MAKVTWLGDEDPSAQVIEQYGHRFVKGEPVNVDDNHPMLGKFRHASVFSVDEKAEPVASVEPAPVDPEAGTEVAALKAKLDARGVSYRANASLDNLRKSLAEA